jgi:hypothetical protein
MPQLMEIDGAVFRHWWREHDNTDEFEQLGRRASSAALCATRRAWTTRCRGKELRRVVLDAAARRAPRAVLSRRRVERARGRHAAAGVRRHRPIQPGAQASVESLRRVRHEVSARR